MKIKTFLIYTVLGLVIYYGIKRYGHLGHKMNVPEAELIPTFNNEKYIPK